MEMFCTARVLQKSKWKLSIYSLDLFLTFIWWLEEVGERDFWVNFTPIFMSLFKQGGWQTWGGLATVLYLVLLGTLGNVGWLLGPDSNISTSISWIYMNFRTYIHGPERANPTDFGDPLIFSSATTRSKFSLSLFTISLIISGISQHLLGGLA